METTEEFVLRSNIIILSMEISKGSEREPLFEELLIESRIRLLSLTTKQTMAKMFKMKQSLEESTLPAGAFAVDVSNVEELLAFREKAIPVHVDLWDPNFNCFFNLNLGEDSVFSNPHDLSASTLDFYLNKNKQPRKIEEVINDYFVQSYV